jgi:hypothetical protein
MTDTIEQLPQSTALEGLIDAGLGFAHDVLDTAFRYYRIDDSQKPPAITPLEEMDGAKMRPGGTWAGLLNQYEAANA